MLCRVSVFARSSFSSSSAFFIAFLSLSRVLVFGWFCWLSFSCSSLSV